MGVDDGFHRVAAASDRLAGLLLLPYSSSRFLTYSSVLGRTRLVLSSVDTGANQRLLALVCPRCASGADTVATARPHSLRPQQLANIAHSLAHLAQASNFWGGLSGGRLVHRGGGDRGNRHGQMSEDSALVQSITSSLEVVVAHALLEMDKVGVQRRTRGILGAYGGRGEAAEDQPEVF